jgi:hypothetical protein
MSKPIRWINSWSKRKRTPETAEKSPEWCDSTSSNRQTTQAGLFYLSFIGTNRRSKLIEPPPTTLSGETRFLRFLSPREPGRSIGQSSQTRNFTTGTTKKTRNKIHRSYRLRRFLFEFQLAIGSQAKPYTPLKKTIRLPSTRFVLCGLSRFSLCPLCLCGEFQL